jgi:hypothetical protein
MIEQRLQHALHAELDDLYPDEALRERIEARVHRGRSKVLVLALATTAVLVAVIAVGISIKPRPVQPAADPYASVPAPSDVKIVKPAPGLPPRLAAFSGTWEGKWDDVLPSRLTVERIDRSSAQAIYAYGTSQGIKVPGFVRNVYKVSSNGVLTLDTPVAPAAIDRLCVPTATRCTMHWTFTMSSDLKTVDGRREVLSDEGGVVNMIKMHRAGSENGRSVSRLWLVALLAIIGAALLVGCGVLIGRRGSHRDRS